MPSTTFDDVAERLARALEGSDAGAWIDLDRRIRAALRWSDGIAPAHTWFPAAADRGPTAPELAVALCGPDGRIREAALDRASRSPALLPLVVVRCSDWVEPVRERARAVLRAELPGLAPEALDRLVAVALRTGDRLRGAAAGELLTAALREGPGAGVLVLLDSEDWAVRRLAHRIAVERGLLAPARLAAIAAAGPDVVVRDLCADAAIAAAGRPVDAAVLAPLLGSRLGRVRSAGVTALRGTDRAGEAEPFLYDRSRLVRACARWVLRQAGTDPLPLYRAACAAGDAVPPHAPLGLAECGDRATDGAVLWALTDHERPRVRASAVAGLRALDAVRFDATGFERLLPLLDDDAPRVAREAAKTLAPWADHLPGGALAAGPGHEPDAGGEPDRHPEPVAHGGRGPRREPGTGGVPGVPGLPDRGTRAWVSRVARLAWRRGRRPAPGG
ncbi:hypothetical protein ACH4ZU_24510 [Streptomyces sp. NPDC020472]|uniref:hypothetical protein n=1 Tax=Streptomyces sp. NPDC020472 TaxID=3365075 RepID=UPI0037A1573C